MFHPMTTEYRIEKFSVCRTSAQWCGFGVRGGGRLRERIGSAFLRCKSSLSYVFFNLPLISYPIPFPKENGRIPPAEIRRARKSYSAAGRDGKKLIIILRVPFNQLSYFFTVVNVIFSLPPIQCVPRRQRKRRQYNNNKNNNN